MWCIRMIELTVLLTLVITASGFIQNNFLIEFLSITKDDQQLPKSVFPSGYQLNIITYINEKSFSGGVHINVTCQEPTNVIVLHANENLYINSELVTVKQLQSVKGRQSYRSLHITEMSRNASLETVNVTLQEELKLGTSYQIYFHFNGTFTGYIMQDFFRSRYTDQTTGQQSWYVGTKFLSKYARRVFPCFDEPSFKASFKISVARPTDKFTLSMMPRQSTEISEKQGWVWDHFPPTPPLSTFSVGLFVSDFESSDPVTVSNTKIQFYYRRSYNITRLKTVMRRTSELFDFLQKFFDVSYPVPKMDVVVIPQIVSVRMSNSMGLIMVPEDYFSENEDPTFLNELVYQWIHHTATPSWWNDFNITIALGSYLTKLGYLEIIDKKSWYTALYGEYYNKFSSPSGYFDTFGTNELWNSAKGEMFLRMLHITLTESSFKKAFSHFLSARMYGTYSEDNLWAALTQQSHADRNLPESITVENIVDSWLHDEHQRYPALTVKRDYEKNTATLEQNVFSTDPNDLTEEEKKLLWWIPVMYLTPDTPNPDSLHPVAWMKDRNFNIDKLPDSNSFVIVNPTDAGMFLVNYDQHNWELISHHLLTSKTQLPISTRTKILHDMFLLALSGKVEFGVFFNTSLFLHNEREPAVWFSIITLITDFNSHVSWTPVEDKYNAYIHYLLGPIYENVVMPAEKTFDWVFKMLSQSLLCQTAYVPCINEFYREMSELMPTTQVTDESTKSIMPCPEFMTKTDDFSEWFTYTKKLSRYLYSDGKRKALLKKVSGCPGYTMMVQRILNTFIEDGNKMADQDVIEFEYLLRGSPVSSNMTFNFTVKHFDDLNEKFEGRFFPWIAILLSPTINWKTQEDLNRLIHFRDEHKEKLGNALDKIESAITLVTKSVAWGKKNLASVESWFEHIFPQVIKQERKSVKSGRKK